MRAIALYIRDLWKGWVGIMSSTASVVLLAVGLFWKITDRGQLRYWVFTSVVCYAIASFSAWYRIRPALRTELDSVSFDNGVTIDEYHPEYSYVTVRFHMVNTGEADNSVRKYQLRIKLDWRNKAEGEPVPIENLRWKNEANPLTDRNEFRTSLKRGWDSEGAVRFFVPDVHANTIAGKKFSFIVTDVYGVRYEASSTVPVGFTNDIVEIVPAE
jgi:hypothetical protein